MGLFPKYYTPWARRTFVTNSEISKCTICTVQCSVNVTLWIWTQAFIFSAKHFLTTFWYFCIWPKNFGRGVFLCILQLIDRAKRIFINLIFIQIYFVFLIFSFQSRFDVIQQVLNFIQSTGLYVHVCCTLYKCVPCRISKPLLWNEKYYINEKTYKQIIEKTWSVRGMVVI